MPPSLVVMDSFVSVRLAALGPVMTTSEIYRAGIGKRELKHAVAAGDLVRVRRQSLVQGDIWRSVGADERRRLGAMAVAKTCPAFALSHHSALAAHRLPLHGDVPVTVAMAGPVQQITVRRGLHLYPEAGRNTVVDGIPVVALARAIVGVALTMGRDSGVVAGDAALHLGLVTMAELLAEVAALSPHQGRQRAFEAVSLMDGSSESVGESLLRLVVHDLGYAYDTQVAIRDEAGLVVAIVDLMVDDVALEFDGKVKYSGRFGDGTEALWAEKRREDAIRRQGHPVERVIWSELSQPMLIDARIRRARQFVQTRRLRPA